MPARLHSLLGAAVFAWLAIAPPAQAEQWVSFHGACGEWEGHWQVSQDGSGVWEGEVGYAQIGGPCMPPNGQRLVNRVRAALVGNDFFAWRAWPCMIHGERRGDHIRGMEVCPGQNPTSFELRLSDEPGAERRGRDWRNWRDRWQR
jgi:hypothetical protein